jgi:Putative prokaryotic signal transducing protein
MPDRQAKGPVENFPMRVLLRSNNPIRLGFLQALLKDAGIETVLLDQHISAVEGGIGAFPRRLAVRNEDAAAAERILREAGEAEGL